MPILGETFIESNFDRGPGGRGSNPAVGAAQVGGHDGSRNSGSRSGVRTILNPAPAAKLDDSVLKQVDYLTPNETELRILLGLVPNDSTLLPN